jgi:hypothetical protein
VVDRTDSFSAFQGDGQEMVNLVTSGLRASWYWGGTIVVMRQGAYDNAVNWAQKRMRLCKVRTIERTEVHLL